MCTQALQEFATLCKNAELSAVEGMLPFWPRLYCALAIDIDHRVREAAQLAHAAVVKRVGKSIAMYLKQLAGAWFTSQYDTYPLAASAATNSFNSTFPPWKLVDATIHCQWEILMYINDNITVKTAQTLLSTQKSLTSEEMETKYHRVLVSNLQAYSSYLKKIPSSEIENTSSIHEKILTSSRFWKLAKHDVLPIKTAFFNVLTSIMENAEHLLKNEKKRVMTTVINSLDESEPGISSAVWESMLVAITKIDDWHSVVSVDKLVLPKLWRVLRSGGQCCASIVYPNLLPFVSQFPKLSVNTDQLYVNFFDNMRQGFSVKSVQVSRSEMQAVVTSFVECLRYSILVNAENVDLCVRLFKDQLVPVVESCITENTATMKQLLFSEVTHLLRYWSKNRTNNAYKSYVPLIRQFWIELRLLFDKLIDVPWESAVSHTVDAQIEFLLILKHAPDRSRKKLKVKFSSPDDVVVKQQEVKVSETDTDSVFNAELYEFVNALCAIYFDKINDRQSTVYIGPLNKIMKHFASRELFVALSTSFQFNKDFFMFYDGSLRLLLLKNPESMRPIVELIFYFITYINDTEKDKVLKSLVELNDIAITRSVVYSSLSKCNRNDRVIKEWYTQANVTKLLIDVAKEIVSSEYGDSEKNQDLILLAFETSDTGDALINEEAANEIVSILCDSLSGTDEACPMQFIEFITKLMTLIWSHKQTISSAVEILETLFELCTRGHDDGDSVSAAAVRDSWKEGLVKSSQMLSCPEFNDLIKRCALIIWSKVYNTHTTHIRVQAKDTLVDLATDVLEVIINNNDDIQLDCVKETILLFLTASCIKLWAAEATALAIYGEIATGNLYVTNLERKIQIFQECTSIDVTNDTIMDNMVACLEWAVFTADLLNNLHKKLRCSEVGEVDASSNFQDAESHNLDLPGMTEILVNIIYVSTVAEIYSKHYKSTKHYNDVNKLLDSLKSSFVSLQEHYQENIHDDVLSHIRTNHMSYGYMLLYIIRTYYAEFKPSENPVEYYEICKNSEEEHDKEARLQGIQVFSDHLASNNLPLLTDNDIHKFSDDGGSVNTNITEKITSYQKENPALLLLDQDISDVSWDKMILPLEIIRTLTTLVREAPTKLTQEHWDFILISLTMWQQSADKSKRNYTDIKITALIAAISQLYYELQSLMNKHEQETMSELPSTLLDEWKNVFAGDIHKCIAQTWKFCVNLHNEDTATIKSTVLLDYLGRAISIFDKNILLKKCDVNARTVNIDEMLELSLRLLQSPVPSIQLGAYHVLKHMVTELVQQDKVLIESENFEPSGLNIRRLEAVLLSTQNIVNTMLIEFK